MDSFKSNKSAILLRSVLVVVVVLLLDPIDLSRLGMNSSHFTVDQQLFLYRICRSICGDSKLFIRFHRRRVRVPWISWSINVHRMDLVRSNLRMEQRWHSSLFLVPIGSIKMESKIILFWFGPTIHLDDRRSVFLRCRNLTFIYRRATIFDWWCWFEIDVIVWLNGQICLEWSSKSKQMLSMAFFNLQMDCQHRIHFFKSCPVPIRIESDKFSPISLATNQSRRSRQSANGHFEFVFARRLLLLWSLLSILVGGIPAASVSISSLDSPWVTSNVSSSFNASALEEFESDLNRQANVGEHLIQYLIALPVNSWNTIQIQSKSLIELTQSTNQLSRSLLVRTWHSFFYRKCLDSIVKSGLDSMSSLSFHAVGDVTTNSSWRSSNVVESTRSMCNKSSHGQFVSSEFNITMKSLSRQSMGHFNNERMFWTRIEPQRIVLHHRITKAI